MEALTYLDFELQVQRAGDHYKADVVRSPVGEASNRFELPFSHEALENLILRVGAHRGRARGLSSTELEAARELGGSLFDAVFTGDVRSCLHRSMDAAERQAGVGLRLKLRLQAVAELADLPWEFLYDVSQGHFLAQSRYTPLVRYVEMPQRIQPLAVRPPLRVLIMISAPDDPAYAKLDVEHERRQVQEALDPVLSTGKVDVDWLEDATLGELRRALHDGTYHVFHFIGHGGFDAAAGGGLLILEDEQNRGLRAGAHSIGPLLHDHRSLRLCVLNACEGARGSRDDSFSSIATSLVRRGIPAVVAMQFEITDRAAITFARGFYAAIAEGYPVDMAVAEARSAIFVQPNDIEWATPVLYMRSRDGVIFDITGAPPAVEPEAEVAELDSPVPARVAPRNGREFSKYGSLAAAILSKLTCVPGDFTRLLYEPRRFLVSRGQDSPPDLARAVVFLLVFQVIGDLLLRGAWQFRSSIVESLSGAVILGALGTIALSVPLHLAWRLVGARGEYRGILVILLYQFSFVGLGYHVVGFILGSTIEFSTPGALSQAARNPSADSSQELMSVLLQPSAYVLIATWIEILITLALLIWLLVTWGAYRATLHQSRLRSWVALALFAFFCLAPLVGLVVVWTRSLPPSA